MTLRANSKHIFCMPCLGCLVHSFERNLHAILQTLLLAMYKCFSYVLTGRLRDAFKDKEVHRSDDTDGMAIDLEDSSAMDLDQENGGPKKRYTCSDLFFAQEITHFLMVIFPNVTISNSNGGRTSSGYSVTEGEQWCLSTLGYVKAFSRQYATEVCF